MLYKTGAFLTYVAIGFAAFFIITYAFEDNSFSIERDGPSGLLINYSECKIPDSKACPEGNSSSEDCISYKYDGNGTLYLTHINSCFSLLPGELSALINISGDSILIEECESCSGSFETCFYDLEYMVSNLEARIYTINVRSPYSSHDSPLEFKIDLSKACDGCYSINRDEYPWKKG